ncbi:hypothetical protein C0Q70_05801 [Pomacea canaliculata]|uniref:Cyclic nucleotide-binding domain-containing protein n=1 Tax=Pomacea canaliculata TaxID=400727 RepID=A0A2T7PM71_POMCA|nr:hypothetical protein C0Q70_05801 [Pomacea canaliculata]
MIPVLNISNEAKAILTSRPDMRTPEQLHVALLSLSQTVPAFSEYPKAMQVSWSRPGALVTAKEEAEEGKVSHRTIAILKKGMSFGESCLFSGCRRIATVTSKDNMEVLVIARDDYIDIFHQDTSDGQEPEHISFLRSIRLFQDWPVSSLTLGDPSVCVYTYARRGTLLCKDSEEGEWIYVIKCGSCQVLKELTSVTPNRPCGHKTETSRRRSGGLQVRSACNKHIQELESALLKRGPSSLAAGVRHWNIGKRSREDTEVEDCITRKKPSEEDRCFVQILTLRPKDVYIRPLPSDDALKRSSRQRLTGNHTEPWPFLMSLPTRNMYQILYGGSPLTLSIYEQLSSAACNR